MFIRGRNEAAPSIRSDHFYAGPGGAQPNTIGSPTGTTRSRGWVVTNTGTKNNGQPGDVIIAWLKVLDESFDGPRPHQRVYFMVVNGLDRDERPATDCSQEITLNFLNTFSALSYQPPDRDGSGSVLPIVQHAAPNWSSTSTAATPPCSRSPAARPSSALRLPGRCDYHSAASRTNLVGTTLPSPSRRLGPDPLAYQWRKEWRKPHQ